MPEIVAEPALFACPRAITLDEQITTVHRALALLTVMCRARVDQGHMTQTRADSHMATMEAVLGTLQRVQAAQRASIEAVFP